MNALERICEDKLEHIKQQKKKISLSGLEEKIRYATVPRGFTKALRNKEKNGQFALIAELKKASPSKGLIRPDFAPATIAREYTEGGAACLSVLTDMPYFQGADEYLGIAREASGLPILRKDFMLDVYQIAESRALGADAVLLIIAALEVNQAMELEAAAIEFEMDVLIEIHDQKELESALNYVHSPLIGVNNRDLKSLKVDLNLGKELSELIPSSYIKVCESGIASHQNLLEMQQLGFSSFLVGESLMRQQNIKKATQELLGLES